MKMAQESSLEDVVFKWYVQRLAVLMYERQSCNLHQIKTTKPTPWF
jgi:hypothetical protein